MKAHNLSSIFKRSKRLKNWYNKVLQVSNDIK